MPGHETDATFAAMAHFLRNRAEYEPRWADGGFTREMWEAERRYTEELVTDLFHALFDGIISEYERALAFAEEDPVPLEKLISVTMRLAAIEALLLQLARDNLQFADKLAPGLHHRVIDLAQRWVSESPAAGSPN